ncbi:protein-glutamine gamma-glutamyltransferase E-like [Bombina bombina]|uniref:protein-glutamine gamma-glutamyltransferase E-like n=1 Tax=Bombina bombina TaxID=8345 RepID=UPI00235B1A61|nr:protein-glutamine gamma-glutamyltransferase E-like [Bombina bombina]
MTSLQLISANFQRQANAIAHRTNDYINKTLIVRRGQPFSVSLNFNRAMRQGDSLALTVTTGPSPSESTNTRAVMPVSRSGSTTSWSAKMETSSNNTQNILMNIPVNAVVGSYQMGVQITSVGRTTSRSAGEFMVIFNPWASGDDVFMSNNQDRNEYVLNDIGVIAYGSANSRASRQWDYGQFEEGIIDIIFKLLNSSLDYRRDRGTEVSKRNNPIHVARVLSAMVNSNNDNGVTVGNWSGDYSGGSSPTRWNGSVAILRSWNLSGPVKFGQCWVFAGVLCTALRCLGIPARVITNFESAHDTNSSLTVDRYFDSRGRSLGSSDSVWNFHVWNEGWFVRKDLGAMYNKWQILDATPQEPSEGIYCLGPTSQNAIKEGAINLDYDGPFVFAEVNADRIDWLTMDDGTNKKIYSETSSVGRFISTKAVGLFSVVDITDQYKYPEGTDKEREIFNIARGNLPNLLMSGGGFSAFGASSRLAARESMVANAAPAVKPDISGAFKKDGEKQVGEDFTITLTLKNNGSTSTDVKVNITASTIVYTGAPVKEILKESQSVTLGPNKEKNIPLTITYDQYSDALTTDNMIQIVAVCEDGNGGELLVDTVIVLKNPPLLLKISGQPIINKAISVEILFSNPIAEDVDKCQLTIDGSGLLKDSLVINLPSLKPNQRSKTQFDMFPYRTGIRGLIVDFSSAKFSDVKAFKDIKVLAA